jgi:hypothetical protein
MTRVPEGFVGPPSGTLGKALLLGLRGVGRLRCFFGFTLSELPTFFFQEVLGMSQAVFGLPVVATELSWPFLARDAKFSPDFPHKVTYESSDLLAFPFAVASAVLGSYTVRLTVEVRCSVLNLVFTTAALHSKISSTRPDDAWLGFKVKDGRYRWTAGEVGFDGI